MVIQFPKIKKGWDRMIAFCGLVCSECPVFSATQKDDAQHKTEIAKSWSGITVLSLNLKI